MFVKINPNDQPRRIFRPEDILRLEIENEYWTKGHQKDIFKPKADVAVLVTTG